MRDCRISAYFATRDHARQQLGLEDVVASYLSFACEVVVCDVGSQDGTWEGLVQLARNEPRLRLLRHSLDPLERPHALDKGKAVAREACRASYVFEGAPDILVEESDAPSFAPLMDRLDAEHPALALPVLHYRGGVEHIRRDRLLSRPCLSRNDPTIGHDASGAGYVDRTNGEAVSCLEFLPAILEALRHDGSHAAEVSDAFGLATRAVPVLWCHSSIDESLPAHRLPAELLPTPNRRDRVLRPLPKGRPAGRPLQV